MSPVHKSAATTGGQAVVQRTIRTQFDPQYPWLATFPWMGCDPEDPKDPTDPADPPTDPTDPPTDPPKDDKVDRTELEAVRARMSAADKRAAAAEAELKKLRDKDKSETELAQQEAKAAKAEAEAAREELRKQRIANAFLSDNTHEWHNPTRALALADLSEVTIKEDGTVVGLKAALDKLAKSDSYLLKSKEDESKDPKDGKPSGDPKDGKKPKESTADKDRLAARFPVLRSRL
jgi:hypothetical protein